jgi:hypothetical protein
MVDQLETVIQDQLRTELQADATAKAACAEAGRAIKIKLNIQSLLN